MAPKQRVASQQTANNISSIEAPTANLNKPAVAATSLYQSCITVRERLHCVPGFEIWLDPETNEATTPATLNDPTQASLGAAHDPTTQLWQVFRLGAPLCTIFNALRPASPLEVDTNASLSNVKDCKKSIYKFLVACKKELAWTDTDLFGITDPYQDDTNGFVKVLKTVSALIDELEKRKLLVESRRPSTMDDSDPNKPNDNRAKVVNELLQTERKYVQDLEALQAYMREIQRQEILPADIVHLLFANLNGLVDFQRRFLIGVEKNAAMTPENQRFGQLFQEMEEGFAVYFPFCANYKSATELAINETPNLRPLAHMVEPTYELPSLLIKPVQRICKYPLLLSELLKYTEQAQYPHYTELEAGLESIKRVTDRVNEVQRQSENLAVVSDLEQRVEDWKGHNISTFGSLLLEDVFIVSKNDSEREYHVYLFERILLCCKEVSPSRSSRTSRNDVRNSKKLPPGGKPSLQLKGRIFINNVTNAIQPLGSTVHALQVFWRGDVEQESFTLRCRNEEQLKQWESHIKTLIQDNMTRKQSISQGFVPASRRTPSNTQLASTLGLAEPSDRYRQDADATSFVEDDEVDQGFERYEDEDEYDEATGEYIATSKSRVQSAHAPPIHKLSLGPQPNKPRAMTEGSSGPNMSQWRTPGSNHAYRAPPIGTMPRSSTASTAMSSDYFPSSASTITSFGRDSSGSVFGRKKEIDLPEEEQLGYDPYSGSMRHSAMSRNMSTNGADYPRGSYQSQTMGRSQSSGVATYTNGYAKHAPGQLTGDNRSISTPNIHVPNPAGARVLYEGADLHDNNYGAMPYPSHRQPGPGNRHSNSSTSSMEFQPGHMRTGSRGTASIPSGSIKVKVSYQDDIFVIIASEQIEYRELIDKIERKVKLCGPRNEAIPLRVRYQDEDGDYITINSDEDVQMAFDWSRNYGTSVVSLFVQ